MTEKQLKMWSRETVRRNRIEPADTENLSNSQKCLITLHIVGWVINLSGSHSCLLNAFTALKGTHFYLKGHMINRILHSWSFHMKFIKISYEMTTSVISSNNNSWSHSPKSVVLFS